MSAVETSYFALLLVQAAHLLHHRLAKRHISFAECLTAIVLLYPPRLEWMPAWAVLGIHCVLILVQIVGSVWIRKLSPNWEGK